MDTRTKAQRSWNMSRIKSKNTKPELIIRSYLHKNGLRFRVNQKKLQGKPDIVLKKYNTIVFVNGCFWHNHSFCSGAKIPKTNRNFWLNKLNRNKRRDAQNYKLLSSLGWKVIVIWECELNKIIANKNLIKEITS